MFQKYKELIHSIFNGIVNGESTATVKDYFSIVGCTLAIIGVVVLMIVLFWGAYQLPKFIWNKTTQSTLKKIQSIIELTEEECREFSDNELEELDSLDQKIKRIKGANIIGIACVYIPILVPLILILVDFIISLF